MSVIAPERSTEVVKAQPQAVPELAAVLGRAFEEDPAMRWFLPEDSTRRHRLERMFGEVALPDTLAHDEVYSTEAHDGAALWLPPGKAHSSFVESLKLVPRMASIFGRRTPKVLRGLAWMEANHPRAPHYYLWLLGVSPEAQGQGKGTALMRPVLERADAERTPAYLEATSPSNRDLYLRHGFEVTDEAHWPGGGPPLWLMWREPV